MPIETGEITVLLAKWRNGENSVFEQLMPLVDKTDDRAPYFAIVLVAGRAWHR